MKTASLAVIATLGTLSLAVPASAYESHHSHMVRQHHMVDSHAKKAHAGGVGGTHQRTTATGGNPGGYSSRN